MRYLPRRRSPAIRRPVSWRQNSVRRDELHEPRRVRRDPARRDRAADDARLRSRRTVSTSGSSGMRPAYACSASCGERGTVRRSMPADTVSSCREAVRPRERDARCPLPHVARGGVPRALLRRSVCVGIRAGACRSSRVRSGYRSARRGSCSRCSSPARSAPRPPSRSRCTRTAAALLGAGGLAGVAGGSLMLGFAPTWGVALAGGLLMGLGDGLIIAGLHILMAQTSRDVPKAVNDLDLYFAFGAVLGPCGPAGCSRRPTSAAGLRGDRRRRAARHGRAALRQRARSRGAASYDDEALQDRRRWRRSSFPTADEPRHVHHGWRAVPLCRRGVRAGHVGIDVREGVGARGDLRRCAAHVGVLAGARVGRILTRAVLPASPRRTGAADRSAALGAAASTTVWRSR